MSPLAPDDPRHGTFNGYASHRCRCDECRRANAAYHRQNRARLTGTLGADDPAHGTLNGYGNYCCRCDACRAVKAAYQRARRAKTSP